MILYNVSYPPLSINNKRMADSQQDSFNLNEINANLNDNNNNNNNYDVYTSNSYKQKRMLYAHYIGKRDQHYATLEDLFNSLYVSSPSSSSSSLASADTHILSSATATFGTALGLQTSPNVFSPKMVRVWQQEFSAVNSLFFDSKGNYWVVCLEHVVQCVVCACILYWLWV